MDWTKPFRTKEAPKTDVGDFLRNLYKNQKFTDVTFVLRTDKSVGAHRVVLASKSPYFEERLFGSKRRGFWQKESLEMRMVIKNVEPDAFQCILDYLYTDEIDFKNEPSVFEIYGGAKEYDIQPLVERCVSLINDLEITAPNVCSLYQKSDAKNVEFFTEKCVEFIEQHTEEVINTADFNKHPYSTIHMICNLKSLSLSHESQLLDAIVKWINAQSSHIQPEIAKPLMACIRFLTFSTRAFSQFIQKNESLISPGDAIKIMMNVSGTGKYEDLPSWCNRHTDPRCIGKIDHPAPNGSKRVDKNKINRKITFPLELSTDPVERDSLACQMILTCRQGFFSITNLKFLLANSAIKSDGLKIDLTLILNPSGYTRQQSLHAKNNKFKLSLGSLYIQEGDILVINIMMESLEKKSFFQISNEKFCNKDFYYSVISENHLFCVYEIEYQCTKQNNRWRRDKFKSEPSLCAAK